MIGLLIQLLSYFVQESKTVEGENSMDNETPAVAGKRLNLTLLKPLWSLYTATLNKWNIELGMNILL